MRAARFGLMMVLACEVLAGHAYAGYFTLDKYEAMQLQQISVSSGDSGFLFAVTDDPLVYGGPMQGMVGFVGRLWNLDADQYASMKIGAAGTSVLSGIQAAGSFTGFQLFMGNDDDDPWDLRLYVDAGVSYSSGFTTLTSDTHTTAVLDFGAPVDFTQVTDIGFEVRGHFVPGGKPSNPDYFHVSVVPVPGAFGLTLFGLGVGLRWRRHA